MRPMRTLIAIVCVSVLPACAGSTPSVDPVVAGLRLDPPPTAFTAPIPVPVRLPGRAITRGEVERAWARDRAALVTGRRRHAALADWYKTRDAALAGPMVLAPVAGRGEK